MPMAGPACHSAQEEAGQARAPVTNMAGEPLALLAIPPGAQFTKPRGLVCGPGDLGAGCLCQGPRGAGQGAPCTSSHRDPALPHKCVLSPEVERSACQAAAAVAAALPRVPSGLTELPLSQTCPPSHTCICFLSYTHLLTCTPTPDLPSAMILRPQYAF